MDDIMMINGGITEVPMSLKRQLRKTRSIISVSTYKRPRIFVILMMLLINIVILLIAALIALWIDPSFDSYLDALANGSIKWLLSPNAILSITNPNTLFLAVVVLIVGLVLFSGTIIALTTNAIKDYFQKKESNSGKIYLENHIVILNWNNKVPELVSDLLFLEDERLTVVILSELDKSWIEKHLINVLKKTQSSMENLNKVNLLVKQGNPLLKNDLSDISIEQAKSIMIMNRDTQQHQTNTFYESDLNVIKIVLGLGDFKLERKPTIVVEVKAIQTKYKLLDMSKIVSSLKDENIIPVCFDRRLGQIIAQTIIDGKIDDVYLSLFSFQGSEVYCLENKTFDDVLLHHSHAIPLGKTSDHVYVLSDNNQVKHNMSSNTFLGRKINVFPLIEKTLQDVVIVGDNHKLAFITESFKAYEALHQSKFVLSEIRNDQVLSIIPTLESKKESTTLLLLSDEHAQNDFLDANVISTLIDLKQNLKRKDIHIIVELLDPKNDRLIQDFNIDKTIISNKIISLLLSKLALHPETATFYDQLLTIAPNEEGKDDDAIIIREAKFCFDTEFPIKFHNIKELVHSSYLSYDKQAIMFGIFRNENLQLFGGNLHEQKPFQLESSDYCIWMKL
jgi:hypothetical protein